MPINSKEKREREHNYIGKKKYSKKNLEKLYNEQLKKKFI